MYMQSNMHASSLYVEQVSVRLTLTHAVRKTANRVGGRVMQKSFGVLDCGEEKRVGEAA